MKFKYKTLFFLIFLFPFIYVLAQSQEELTKRVEELEKDVLDLQISSMLSKVMISGEFFNTYSKNETFNNRDGKKNRHNENYIGNLLININSSIGSDVQIYTTLYSSFFYGSNVLNPGVSTGRITDSTTGNDLSVAKAYLDYKIWEGKLIFSLGRMSTIYGPPSHIYDLTARTGTYPMMGFSSPFDGGALTWNWRQTFSLRDDFDVRLIYAVLNRGNPGEIDAGLSAQSGTERIADNIHLYSVMFDYGTKRFPKIASDMHAIVQGYYGKLKSFPSMRAYGILDSQYPGDNDLYEVYTNQDDLMDLYALIAHIELSNAFQLPLDTYITYKRNWMKSHADVMWKIIDDGSGGSGAGAGFSGRLGGYFTEGYNVGDAILVGTQYKVSSKIGIGAEYLYTSDGTLGTTNYTKTSTQFYDTVGKGYHIYYTQSLKADRMNYRLGYLNSLSKKELVDVIHVDSQKRTISYYAHLGVRF